MATIDVDNAGGLVLVRWDDTARVVTAYDEAGLVQTSRPYTAAENAAADARAAGAVLAARRETDRLAVRGILTVINGAIDAALAQKAAMQTLTAATAPTSVAQCWTQIKAVAVAVRETEDALKAAAQGVKDLARYVAP